MKSETPCIIESLSKSVSCNLNNNITCYNVVTYTAKLYNHTIPNKGSPFIQLTCFNFLYFQTKGKTWLIFGINFCDVQMKFRYYLKYSTNFFVVKSYITLCHQVYYDILALACLPLNQTFSVRNTSDEFCISVAKVAKIMDSGLKDTLFGSVIRGPVFYFNTKVLEIFNICPNCVIHRQKLPISRVHHFT